MTQPTVAAPGVSGPVLSLIVPTYNEAENIGPLLEALDGEFEGVDVEFLVVDDDSPDGTAERARAASKRARVIVRTHERGLATAVVRGIREARGRYVAVMDADWQHPVGAVHRLLERARGTDADLVIGSRYTQGGGEEGFGPLRRLISQGAALIAKVALPPVRKHRLTDPMSGLFLARRDRIDPDVLRPSGYKILLEVLGRHELDRVEEVGYTFQSRRGGDSKLGGAVIWQYLLHVLALGAAHPENQRVARFGTVGLTGVAVNLGILYLLKGVLGVFDLVAVPIAVEASIIWNFLLNDRFTFQDRRRGHKLARLARFNAVSLVALAVNVATYAALTRLFGVHYLAAEAIAIVVAFGANYVGNLQWTYGGLDRFRLRDALRSRVAWIPFFLLVIGAGMTYFHDLDSVDAIYFDEHYYLSVAQQARNGVWMDPCWDDDELDMRPLNYEHPPLAKLIITWSVDRFQDFDGVFSGCRDPDSGAYDAFTDDMQEQGQPYAWRGPSAVMGTATVLFAGLAAGRLFGGPLPAFLAGAFVFLDNLILVMSRVAVLDIFATAFMTAAVWAATFGSRRGTLASALLLGLGFACKYYVAFAGVPVLLINVWAHARHAPPSWRRALRLASTYAGAALAVWVLCYIPWWRIWIPELGLVGALVHFAKVTGAALAWGAAGQQTNDYLSRPHEWFTMGRPMRYYGAWGIGPDDKVRYIYSIGNPVMWWSAAAAVLAPLGRPAWLLVRRGGERGDLRAWWSALGRTAHAAILASALVVGTYGSFFLLARDTFLFYMTVVVPTLAIALAGGLTHAFRSGAGWRRALLPVTLALVLAAYLWYYPVTAGTVITQERLDAIFDLLPWMGK